MFLVNTWSNINDFITIDKCVMFCKNNGHPQISLHSPTCFEILDNHEVAKQRASGKGWLTSSNTGEAILGNGSPDVKHWSH